MAEAKRLVNFRLTDEEIEALDRMVRVGVAKDRTDAVKKAIKLSPIGLALETPEGLDTIARTIGDVGSLPAEARRRLELSEAARQVSPAEIEILPGGGLINVILGDRQRVLARVIAHNGKTLQGAVPKLKVEPPEIAQVLIERDGSFLQGRKEGKGVLTATYGDISAASFIDVWENHPEMTVRVPTPNIKGPSPTRR
jgi:hypothetical protein